MHMIVIDFWSLNVKKKFILFAFQARFAKVPSCLNLVAGQNGGDLYIAIEPRRSIRGGAESSKQDYMRYPDVGSGYKESRSIELCYI